MLVIAADALALAIVVALGYPMPGVSLQFVLATAAVTVVAWRLSSLYSRRMALSILDELPSLALGVIIGLATATILSMLTGGGNNSERRGLLVGTSLLAATGMCRWGAYSMILFLRRKGWIYHPAVMIGAGAGAAKLARRILDHPEGGLRLVGRLVNTGARHEGGAVPILGTSLDLVHVVHKHHVTNVVIGYGGMTSADLVEVLRLADRDDLQIHVVPRLFELCTLRSSDDHIWGLPLVRLRSPADRRLTRPVKRLADVVGACLGLVLTGPALLAVAIAVRLEVGSPILYRQTRVGARGRPFSLLKFRSMPDTTSQHGTRWAVPEQEIGPVGRLIRRYSLDELPQLWNVLRGEMSLVGPRPERPEYVAQFVASYPGYVHRHRVPVGMTGLAAVNGLRGDTSIGERANFDNWYIENWSLWLDTKILLRTVSALLRGSGG